MQADDNLNRLAAMAGIEPRFWDIEGRLYETAPETTRAVLDALGLAAGTDADAAKTLDLLREEEWGAVLPPVITARERDEIAVPMRLPLDAGARKLRWLAHLEDGETRGGECDLDDLPVKETGVHAGSPRALRMLTLEPLPVGYHELHVEAASEATCPLIVAPARCYLPSRFVGKRFWGVAAQLYALNSSRNWGIGDFGDLGELAELSADRGADAVGLNPLHALFLDAPEQASPYSPSSRLFRNPLFLDISAIPDWEECEAARALVESADMRQAIEAVRGEALIDYEAVAKLKLPVLERLYDGFRERHVARGTARGRDFLEYVEQSGDALQRFAVFQTLTEHFETHDWRRWPAAFQDRRSKEVEDFQHGYAHRVTFFAWLQWLCEDQLSQAARKARERDMAIGLYNDFAVGVDAAGFDHWAHKDVYAGGLRIGAPPDPFNEHGQEWGVVPFNPRRLKKVDYAQFREALRANMRHAGALRIDHIIGWRRLFVIPEGASPDCGAYVRFPLDDLLAIAALESHRNRCIVIGEDLGTVPEGFRDRMAQENILSCRIFYFERDHEQFRRPREYPVLAAVSASTHDLATLRGFWCGDDIDAKRRIGAYASNEEETAAQTERAKEKRLLLEALAEENLLPEGWTTVDADHGDWAPQLARATELYLARTPCMLLMIGLDDLAGELHQTNLPGSTAEYPNWRRRLSRAAADLLNDADSQEMLREITQNRRQ